MAVALRAGGGVISRRQHPELTGIIDWQLRQGHLRVVLPGVYADAELTEPAIDLLAARLWRPEATLTGRAAAKLTFWPEIRLDRINLAGAGARSEHRGRFRVQHRQVLPELIRRHGGFAVTDPALTALDLCADVGGDGIDAALRTRTATLAGMSEAIALCPNRRGNRDRRALLLDSRAEPWSAAERLQHRPLRAAGLTDWSANFPVTIEGRLYYLDVAFPRQRLAIEIDGRGAHGADRFEADRWRQNDLLLAGWTVLRFTWAMLVDDPDEVIRAVRTALA